MYKTFPGKKHPLLSGTSEANLESGCATIKRTKSKKKKTQY